MAKPLVDDALWEPIEPLHRKKRDAAPAGAHDTERGPEPWPAIKAWRRRWAKLLRRVFAVDVEVCPRYGGAMRMLAFVTEPAVVRRILAHS